MGKFEQSRDLFYRRAAKSMSENAARLFLVNPRATSLRDNFAFPGTDFEFDIEAHGHQVGTVDYSISPLQDRVYINNIEVVSAHRRQGVALGTLWHLWITHKLPIVPLDQATSSDGFWSRARRRFAAAGATIGEEIRGHEAADAEKQRWQHLIPESEAERSQRKYWAWVASEHAAGRPAGPGIR